MLLDLGFPDSCTVELTGDTDFALPQWKWPIWGKESGCIISNHWLIAPNKLVHLKQSRLKLLSTSRTSRFPQRFRMRAFVSGQQGLWNGCHHPQQNRSAVLSVGDASLVSLLCSENTSRPQLHSPKEPTCGLWKSPWKQWNKSLNWNLEFIPVLHRKKIRYRTTKPIVPRNLGRLWLTWKSSIFSFTTLFFIEAFIHVTKAARKHCDVSRRQALVSPVNNAGGIRTEMLSNILEVAYLTLLQATKKMLFFQYINSECYHFPLG